MDNEDKALLWKDTAKRAAKFVAKDFPEVDAEDLEQDLLVYILGNERLTDPEDDDYSYYNLLRVTRSLAWDYRKQHLTLTQYAYRTTDVKRILETYFDSREWLNPLSMDMQSVSLADKMVVHSDIGYAYDRLKPNAKREIFKRYALKEFPEDNATEKRLAYAIEKLTDILNTYNPRTTAHEGLGDRKVISNRAAQAKIQDQY